MTEKYNEIVNVCPHFDGYCKCSEIVANNMGCVVNEESTGCAYLGGNPITKEDMELGFVHLDCSCSMFNEHECSMNVMDYISWDFTCPYKGT